jgi:hypothetical protein
MARKSVKRRSRGRIVLLLILLAKATISRYFYASRRIVRESRGAAGGEAAGHHLDLRCRSKTRMGDRAIIPGKADWQRAGTAFEEERNPY